MTFDPYVRNAIKQAEGRRREFYLFVSVLIDNVVDVRIVVDLLVVIDHTFHTGMLFLPVDLDLLAKPARRKREIVTIWTCVVETSQCKSRTGS